MEDRRLEITLQRLQNSLEEKIQKVEGLEKEKFQKERNLIALNAKLDDSTEFYSTVRKSATVNYENGKQVNVGRNLFLLNLY
jgi:predicted  nucleic acid-binding Zn-ribbon protein